MKRDEKQRGSITVEAALILPIFIFAVLMIYQMMNFVKAQQLIQYAADQTAKEVAQYSYLLEKLGILDSVEQIHQEAGDFQKNVEEINQNFAVLAQAAEQIGAGESVLQNVGNVFDTAENSPINGYIKDPMSFLNGAVSAVKSGAINALSSYMISVVSEASLKKQLSLAGKGGQPEEILKKFGVTKISMKESEWCRGESREVKIIVDFEMEARMPFFPAVVRQGKVCASTRIWSGV